MSYTPELVGQQTMAASEPVVIASDQSAVPVGIVSALPAGSNNIGDVDIASAIPAGTNYIGKIRMTDGTNDVTLKNLTNAKAVPTAIVDGNGDQITSFGGGTQYTEGDTDASITGTAFMWEDASNTLRAVSAAKPLPVDMLALDDAILTDNAAFTPTSSKVLMVGFEYDDTSPDSVNEGDAGAARMSANRCVYTQIRDAQGNERGAYVDTSNRLAVAVGNTPSVNVAQINNVNISTGTGNSGTGTQRVVLASDQPTVPVSGTFWQATQPVSGTVTASNTAGDVAHDGADSGNPVKVGGVARTANPTAVANGDRVNCFRDDVGRSVVVLNQCRDLVGSQVTTINSSTSETTIVTAGGSGVFNDLTHLTITNSSASPVVVTLKDATGGTTRGIYSLAANGGIVLTFPTPKAQATANNNWTLTCGASVDSVYVVAEFIKNV